MEWPFPCFIVIVLLSLHIFCLVHAFMGQRLNFSWFAVYFDFLFLTYIMAATVEAVVVIEAVAFFHCAI